MSIEQVTNVVEIAIHKLPYMEDLYKQVTHEVDNFQRIRQWLINHIDALKYRISLFNKTSFSSEQDCKRTEQQELSAQKNRLEKVDCKDVKQWWKRE